MILSVTFSKPVKNVSEILGGELGSEYTRVKIKLLTSSLAASKNENYFAEFYTKTQVFHKKMSEAELKDFISAHAGTTFKNCVERTESEEITILANKKGKITELRKKIDADARGFTQIESVQGAERSCSQVKDVAKGKCYLLPENVPVPFLVHLGIMTAEGKVIRAKYDKFRQINRFLEMLDDILDDVTRLRSHEENPVSESSPLRIVDFGSGKSYLTFAVQYYLSEIKKIPAEIFGLDLKKDVIDYCGRLAKNLSLTNLSFAVGDIASFGEEKRPDIIVTLHACDTATDYALDYALRHEAKAILSVPCCQHEINSQLSAKSVPAASPLAPLLKYGLIKERFSALVTDSLRAELLESRGYRVQMLEFIEESATPKNLLIRAVRKPDADERKSTPPENFESPLLKALGVHQTLAELSFYGNK